MMLLQTDFLKLCFDSCLTQVVALHAPISRLALCPVNPPILQAKSCSSSGIGRNKYALHPALAEINTLGFIGRSNTIPTELVDKPGICEEKKSTRKHHRVIKKNSSKACD